MDLSRSAWYAYINGQTYQASAQDQLLEEKVVSLFWEHKRRYGSRRLQAELCALGIETGSRKVRSIMQANSLIAIQPRRFYPKTPQSIAGQLRSDNLLLFDINWPQRPNEVIVGDITYLPAEENGLLYWLYLAVWMDLFSRRIVGWLVADHLRKELVINAMKQVIRERQPSAGLIVHSDGGGQYGSNVFRQLLARNEFRQSMTRKDNHYDNAHCESLFSRFKAELIDGENFKGLEDAQLQVFEYIAGYYNTLRRHSALGYMSPNEFERNFYSGSLNKQMKP